MLTFTEFMEELQFLSPTTPGTNQAVLRHSHQGPSGSGNVAESPVLVSDADKKDGEYRI